MSLFTKIKTISAALCCLVFVLLTALCLPVHAADSIEDTIRIEYTLSNGFEYVLKPSVVDLRKAEDRTEDTQPIPEYVFLLPKDTEGRAVKVYPESSIFKDVKAEKDGTVILSKGRYTAVVNGEEIAVTVAYTSDIPQMYITVADDAMEKVHKDINYKADGYITITDGTQTQYNGKLEHIKGRGNATWTRNPKPYNIKLASKANLFDMGVSKKYSLLANYSDYTCLKSKLCLEFAQEVGIEYTSDVQFVELYINNEYFGTYSLTERVEVAPGRLEIFDIDFLNEFFNPGIDENSCVLQSDTDTEDGYSQSSAKWFNLPNQVASQINGGYLLELEIYKRYDINDDAGFVSAYGQAVNIKSPEYASEKQVKYIQDYYQQFEDALLSDGGYNSRGIHYSEYIDVDSFAKMYAFQEFVQNYDAGVTSCFIYKDVDGKMIAGPVWDMDVALGHDARRYEMNINNPENMWMAATMQMSEVKGRSIFAILWTHGDFRKAVARQWTEFYADKTDDLYENLVDQAEIMQDSAIWCQYITKNPFDPKTFEEAGEYYHQSVEEVKEYINARAEFLSEYFSEDNNSVIYCRNGGTSFTVDPATYRNGQQATVMENGFLCEDAHFIGWNTQADGSGTSYQPGDTVTFGSSDIVLYAQWDNPPQAETAADVQQNKGGFFASAVIWFKNLLN